jgi:hypothetical protein
MIIKLGTLEKKENKIKGERLSSVFYDETVKFLNLKNSKDEFPSLSRDEVLNKTRGIRSGNRRFLLGNFKFEDWGVIEPFVGFALSERTRCCSIKRENPLYGQELTITSPNYKILNFELFDVEEKGMQIGDKYIRQRTYIYHFNCFEER